MSTTIDPGTSPAGVPAPAEAPAPTPAPARRHRRIPPIAYGILVIAVFFGSIGIAYAGGVWQTSGQMGGGGQAGGDRPALQGDSATEVKGWMAIGDVAETFGIPLETVLAAFNLPADTDPATALKNLESDAFSVMALREWLAAEGHAAP